MDKSKLIIQKISHSFKSLLVDFSMLRNFKQLIVLLDNFFSFPDPRTEVTWGQTIVIALEVIGCGMRVLIC